MRDRQPTQPGRVKLTPENGDASFYAIMEMADEPTEFGTPPTKENLLKDETETALFGSARDRTVNDAFFGIAAKLKLISADMASITLTVKSTSGNPLPGVIINGAYDENGSALITGSDGTASGYVSEGDVTLSVSGYADIVDYSETFTAAKGQSYTKTITLTTRNFLKLTSSQGVKFSGNVETVDVDALGGGGGGAIGRCTSFPYGWTASSGAGGAAGDLVRMLGIKIEPNKVYPAVVGAGGIGGTWVGGVNRTNYPASDGGKSSFGNLVEAAGGACAKNAALNLNTSAFTASVPGTGNNGNGGSPVSGTTGSNGAAGNPGKIGSKKIFASFDTEEDIGGGGASGGVTGNGGIGGTPGGGNGGNGGEVAYNTHTNVTAGSSGKPGTGGGGGGGGAKMAYSDTGDDRTEYLGNGGAGGSGRIAIRMHLTAA